MLTARQYELLLFINERIRESGIAPSITEMDLALGCGGRSNSHRMLQALEQKGFIKRLRKRNRAIEVLRLPENAIPPPAAAGNRASVLTTNRVPAHLGQGVVGVPLRGRIGGGRIEPISGADVLVPDGLVWGAQC